MSIHTVVGDSDDSELGDFIEDEDAASPNELTETTLLHRDIRSIVPFLLQVWLFASPVVYPSSLIDESPEQQLYALNPLVGLLDGFRWSLLEAPPPGAEDLLSLASGVLLLVTGLAYFRHAERQFADQV